jgi:hypothetical protein
MPKSKFFKPEKDGVFVQSNYDSIAETYAVLGNFPKAKNI